MARYAVLRIAKVKTMSHVAGLGMHVERERETRNADVGAPAGERAAGRDGRLVRRRRAPPGRRAANPQERGASLNYS